MSDLPIRTIFISDFRRLDGHRVLPFDAAVVLVHGPNGAGKTSVFSALELALTGEIRNMRRHDPRYTAHLPFHGQPFATLRVDVAEQLAVNSEPVTMTVGGSRIEGPPALSREAAQFFTERCYLDQVSLGQLLELYQYREGKEESALARFVNELLGLEQLDALRTGLSDATDFRRLKKLCEPLANAEDEAQRAATDVSRATKDLESAREVMSRSRSELTESMETLGLAMPETDDEESLRRVADLLSMSQPAGDFATADLSRSLTALGGRIGVLASRPSVRRLEESRAALSTISGEYERWSEAEGASIENWRVDAADLGLDVSGQAARALDEELQGMDRSLARQAELLEGTARLEKQFTDELAGLEVIEGQLSGAEEEVGSLVEGLAALREHAANDVCRVCDREFSEVSSIHLSTHIDRKIAELTNQGALLRELRRERDAMAAKVKRDEQVLGEFRAEMWPVAGREALTTRQAALTGLREQLRNLEAAIIRGRELRRRRDDAKSELEEVEAIALEAEVARSELEELARVLGAPLDPALALEDAWRRLADSARDRFERQSALQRAYARANAALGQTVVSSQRVATTKEGLAESAERKAVWDGRVQEARRRQAIARAVHDASSKARAAIVQRVFTESLNEVWRSVFTRLAPREPFVPAFGIPSSSKTALELTLETVHTSGEPGGAASDDAERGEPEHGSAVAIHRASSRRRTSRAVSRT